MSIAASPALAQNITTPATTTSTGQTAVAGPEGYQLLFGKANGVGGRTSIQFPDNAALEPYKDIISNGIRSRDDYTRAIEFFRALPNLVDAENREYAQELADIVTEFEKAQQIRQAFWERDVKGVLGEAETKRAEYRKAFKAGKQNIEQSVFVVLQYKSPEDGNGNGNGDEKISSSAYCSRTASESSNQDNEFASLIFLPQGAHLYWMIHEIIHAMPTKKLPKRFRDILIPHAITADIISSASIPQIYEALVGNYIRDEARAGLGEILLRRCYGGMGVEKVYPRKFGHLSKGDQQYFSKGMVEYQDEGTYLVRTISSYIS